MIAREAIERVVAAVVAAHPSPATAAAEADALARAAALAEAAAIARAARR